MANLEDVEKFWDENPLFAGESDAECTENFFAQHDGVYAEDVFSGIVFEKVFLLPLPENVVLDLGCGTGYWLSYFKNTIGVQDLTGADLSSESLKLAKARVGSGCTYVHGNAEQLDFPDSTFDHVNCQGVVHHTPDTEAAIGEIYRILRNGGTASISVYFENVGLKVFSLCRPLLSVFYALLGKNLGRGRDFASASTKSELVRLYDGAGNPVGKSYSRAEFEDLLGRCGFSDVTFTYFFFPFRFLKLKIPRVLRRAFVWACPFMIVANCRKA